MRLSGENPGNRISKPDSSGSDHESLGEVKVLGILYQAKRENRAA